MKYVLDANVAIKWVLTEADSSKALALRADYHAQIHKLLAPDVFPVEVAHALTRAERRGIIKQGQAAALLAVVMMNCPRQYPYQPLLQRATANLLSGQDRPLRLSLYRPGRTRELRTGDCRRQAFE